MNYLRSINRVLLVVVLLVGGSLSAAAKSNQEAFAWRESSPEGEEFTANFPAEPRMTVGKRFFGDRQNKYKFHFYSVVSNNTLFLVESYEGDRPKDLLRILMSGRRGITGTADVELNGVKGKEFSHDIEGLSFKGRYFATKKHAYVVQAAKRGAYDQSIDHFLNSFILEHHPGGVLPLGGSTPADDEIFPVREVQSKAIILFKLPATYTDEARSRKLRGTVVLDAILRATGEVTDIRIRRGLGGGLDEQSIEATKAIGFVPAVKDGKPVSQRIMLEYNFNIY
jgi:TonB family protein